AARQRGRWEPQTLASETRTRTASGSTSVQREFADLEGPAGAEEDRRLAGAHRAPPRPTSNASCRVRTASSAYLSSMTHETAISEVEIIWILMPSRARAANMVEATPEWLRMPTPTIETLATRSSWTIPRAPISRA